MVNKQGKTRNSQKKVIMYIIIFYTDFVVFFPLNLKKYTQVILVDLEFYFTFDSVLHDLSLSLYMYIVQLLIGQMCTCPIWLKWW